jgi:mRNA interferase MazF
MTSKLTKTYDLYEVVKVPFPFTDVNKAKIRPALILSSAMNFNGKIGLSIMAMITSQKPKADLWPMDIVVEDLLSAGLHRLILGRLGILSNIDTKKVQHKLKEIFVL